MPIFECSRCNTLSYSAARFASIACDACGGMHFRAFDDVSTFGDVRAEPRRLSPGDHCCLPYAAPEEVAPLCAHIVRDQLVAGSRVMAWPVPDVRAAIAAGLAPDEAAAVEWLDPGDVYGPPFDGEAIVEHFSGLAAQEPRTVVVIGGPGRPLPEIASVGEFGRFERLVTERALETGMVVACLYDRRLHPDSYVSCGDETHTLTAEDGAVRRNERFVFAS
jgi:hypothetical protein